MKHQQDPCPKDKTVCPESQWSRSSLSAERRTVNCLWKAQWLYIQNFQALLREGLTHALVWHCRFLLLENLSFCPSCTTGSKGCNFQLLTVLYHSLQSSPNNISRAPPTAIAGNSAFEVTGTWVSISPTPDLDRGIRMCCLSLKWCWELCCACASLQGKPINEVHTWSQDPNMWHPSLQGQPLRLTCASHGLKQNSLVTAASSTFARHCRHHKK